MSVHGCVCHLSPCGPVMDLRPVQGVPHLSPNDSLDKLQLPSDPRLDLAGIENGWLSDIGAVKGLPKGLPFSVWCTSLKYTLTQLVTIASTQFSTVQYGIL